MKKSITWKVPHFLKNKYSIGIIALIFFALFSWTMIHFSKKVSKSVATSLKTMPYEPLINKKINSDFKAEMFFNNIPNKKPFTPLIIEQIKNAKTSIKLAMYSIDSEVLRNELFAAAKRGVKVEIVLSVNKKNQHDVLFENAPYNLKTYDVGAVGNNDRNLMHHKFVVFDSDTSSQSLIMGAFNWTDLQELYDPSFMLKTQDENMVLAYDQEFERLKTGQSGKAKFTDKNYRPWQGDYEYNNGQLELWWSPGIRQNTIKQRLLDKIYGASSTIDILVWQLTDVDLVKALSDKAKEGVKIRMITDDFNAWRDASKIKELVKIGLKEKNLEIIDDAARTIDFAKEITPFLSKSNSGFNSFLHHHVAIIDGKMFIAGTNNWSYSADYKNDESAVLTTIKDLVDQYQATFDYHYKKLHNQNLNVELTKDVYVVKDLKDFKNQKLVILGEDVGGAGAPNYCYKQDILTDEISWNLSPGCENRVINFFVLNKDGQVLANRLMGATIFSTSTVEVN